MPTTQHKLKLGQVVTTANAQAKLDHDSIMPAIGRHVRGDWGDLDAHDKQVNEMSLSKEYPGRIHSSYADSNGVKFWIITEWDRSVTTVLLPEDY